MKKTILILMIHLTFVKLVFSNEKINHVHKLLNNNIEYIEQMGVEEKNSIIYIKSGFAISDIIEPNKHILNKENTLIKVEYIYTSYKESLDFKQSALDLKRLYELYKVSENIFENELIEWKAIVQTKAKNKEEAKTMYHGFKIYYRERPSEVSTKKEISFLETYLAESDIKEINFMTVDAVASYKSGSRELYKDIINKIKYPSQALENNIQGTVYVRVIIGPDGILKSANLTLGIGFGCDLEALRVIKSLKTWNSAFKNGKAVSSVLTIPVSFTIDGVLEESEYVYYDEISDSSYFSLATEGHSAISYSKIKPDSTIYKIFKRNQNWNNMSVVCDFTGSMSPYTSQLLLWHKMNLNVNKSKVSLFTFFNDGDFKRDNLKKIGRTGGIYQSDAKTYKEIEKLALETMRNGGGGDCPENNIEAALKAINECPDCKELVMIADNFATPRDLELLSKVDKPIKIILCGTSGGINIEYLNMALLNGGSIHTMENDLTNLSSYKENENIKVGKWTYKRFKNTFQKVYEKSLN